MRLVHRPETDFKGSGNFAIRKFLTNFSDSNDETGNAELRFPGDKLLMQLLILCHYFYSLFYGFVDNY